MSDDEIIQAILSKCLGVTKEQVLEAFETEKGKTGGLIADETLLRLIAARYGVEISRETVKECRLLISHLVPSLNSVTVSGRIVAVYPAKTFEGKQPGKYASLMIADKNGILRVMLWNSKTDLVESGMIKAGQVARFSRGYTREDRNGKTELHIGERSEVEVNPEALEKEDYPSIDRFATAIKNITLLQQSIHLIGKIKAISPSSTFTRQDNSMGKVLRFTIADKTGDTLAVAWNEKAEKLEASLKSDMEIKLVNAKVKTASNGGIEVHVDESTYVEFSAVSEQP
jgi:ssDNA-binding replication factor A large subunit